MSGQLPRIKRPVHERLSAALDIAADGCHVWKWHRCKRGYGRIQIGAKKRQAHVVAHEMAVGPVPPGAELDHLCRNRACCNPDHLEPVPHEVNVSRGDSFSARNAAKTACIHGHLFDEANTYWRGKHRQCRACNRAAAAAYLRRKAVA